MLENTNRAAPARILVVDPRPDTRQLSCRVLRLEGYEVHHAGGMAEALGLSERMTFDLLVTDVFPVGGCGLQLMRDVRGRGQGEGVTTRGVLIADAAGLEGVRMRAEEAGFAGVLARPVALERLVEATWHALGGAAGKGKARA